MSLHLVGCTPSREVHHTQHSQLLTTVEPFHSTHCRRQWFYKDNKMIFNEFDQYSQNLLLAQYDIAEIIQHELTKGEVREDFLIQVLQSRFEPPPTFHKGTVSDGGNQAGQIDIMLC